MLTPKEDMEITSLSKRGWSIAAIARHTGRDRKTVRAHLNGEREAGVRQNAEEDPFDRVETYVRQRLADDPHVWATVLFDEVVDLGYDRAYPTFTRKVRERELRPHCEPCQSSTGRATVEIEHPAGEEIQWDCERSAKPVIGDHRKPTWGRCSGRRLVRLAGASGGRDRGGDFEGVVFA
jgi:transposase